MSGHSKWATIKHKKAALDAKRGKAFTNLIKEITVAARVGGGETANNPRLRLLIDKARALNMPLDNVNRAVKRGTGELPGVNYEPFMYEGYAPHGVAVIIETLSDNKNRTVSDLRHAFSKAGGSLAEGNAVSWMFKHKGVVRVSGKNLTEDKILELMIDFEVDSIDEADNVFTIVCDPKALDQVKDALTSAGISIESSDLEWVSGNATELNDEQADKVVQFLSDLEELDDVQNVYSNLG
jgi:YebC/PmpR family DNA-binding regulatory protein